MKSKFYLIILGVLLFASSCTNEQEEQITLEEKVIELREGVDFCMTTYNIQAFCNGPIPPDDIEGTPESYAAQICASISALGSDYVNLQEVWCGAVAYYLEECLREEGYNGFVYDQESGLMSISRENFSTSEVVPFYGPETGADHLVDKGFIHTSFEIMEGCVVHMINTHMQANIPWYEELISDFLSLHPIFGLFTRHSNLPPHWIRRIQLGQIKDYMTQNIHPCQLTIIGGDFNIKKETGGGYNTREFDDLITTLQGQESQLVTSATNEAGDILDYFIFTNYNQFEESIENITNTVHECIDPTVVERYNVYEWDQYDDGQGTLIGTFNNAEEAHALVAEMEASNSGNGLDFVSYYVYLQVTEYCRIPNPSDHFLVETCVENYDCDPGCHD